MKSFLLFLALAMLPLHGNPGDSVTGPTWCSLSTGNLNSQVYEVYELDPTFTFYLQIPCPTSALITVGSVTFRAGTPTTTDGILYVNNAPWYCGLQAAVKELAFYEYNHL